MSDPPPAAPRSGPSPRHTDPALASSPTLLAKLFEAPRRRAEPWALRYGRMWLEAGLYTACGLLIADAIRIQQSGFFAVFLAAAGLTVRLDAILAENRRAIFVERVGSYRANRATAASLLMVFLGSFSVFAVAALWQGERRMIVAFGFVVEAAGLGHDTILTRPFTSVLGLFVQNFLVLLVFFALSLIYRSYGALLALTWNACVWGVVLAFLVRRGMAGSAVPPALFIAVSLAAVLPHLLLEATAYVVGSLAAIFLSKGAFKYAPREPVFGAVMRAVAALTAIALACLLAGALVEATLPRRVLRLLAP